jgi:hypothetical protein
MKKLLLSLLLSAAAAVPAIAQSKAPAFKIKEGSKLIYHVEAGSRGEYDFIVTVKKLGPSVTFDWKMTEPANKSGTVTMSEGAMKDATALFNYFSGGTSNLTEATSVFVSKGLYKEVMANDEVMIKADGADAEPEKFYKVDGMTSSRNGSIYLSMTKELNGKSYNLDGPILENEDGSRGIRFQATEYFPVITYMELGFKIYLTGLE